MRHVPLDPVSAERLARRRRQGWWLIGAALIATCLAWAVLDSDAESPPPRANVVERAAAQSPPATSAAPARAPFSVEGEQLRQAQHALWRERLALAQHTLDSYREGSRYPSSSQPIALHADQAHPNAPVEEELPLSAAASGADRATLRTSQERVYVQGDESVLFTVSARDAAGAVLPLRVLYASAREIAPANAGSLFPVVPLDFNDQGRDGDVTGGDGSFGVRLLPKAQGFAGLSGQIRVEATLQVQGEQGTTYFDIFYTAESPALWQGAVREALEDGSLHVYLKAEVKEAGRYVAKARVDDANGVPFALLTFNDELPQGTQEMRLTVFGKLVRDAQPAFPLVVRDVDAFLLRPDAFPDRSLMPRLA
ncbi:MAG: hypothetical protein ACXWUL_00935, partial [Caldimonas sp.]